MDEKQKILLWAIEAAGEKGLSPVQIQKVMFLYRQNFYKDHQIDFYDFEPYNYGPFNKQIYTDLEFLAEKKLLVKQKAKSNGKWHIYRINTQPQSIEIDIKGKKYIQKLVGWVQGLSFKDLLLAIYEKYPQYKTKSVFIQE